MAFHFRHKACPEHSRRDTSAQILPFTIYDSRFGLVPWCHFGWLSASLGGKAVPVGNKKTSRPALFSVGPRGLCITVFMNNAFLASQDQIKGLKYLPD